MKGITNRRQHRRRKVGIPGLVKSQQGEKFVCRVHELSHSGARITSAYADLPRTFTLYLSSDQRVFRECKVVWQRNLDFGIVFNERDTITPRN